MQPDAPGDVYQSMSLTPPDTGNRRNSFIMTHSEEGENQRPKNLVNEMNHDWLGQQRADLVRDSFSDRGFSQDDSRGFSGSSRYNSSRSENMNDIQKYKTGFTHGGHQGMRRNYYFLEVTAQGRKILSFHTKGLLNYVASQKLGWKDEELRGRASLQLRDIRQVFTGITRYSIEPRGNCILFNLAKIRAIIFKDRAIFLLYQGSLNDMKINQQNGHQIYKPRVGMTGIGPGITSMTNSRDPIRSTIQMKAPSIEAPPSATQSSLVQAPPAAGYTGNISTVQLNRLTSEVLPKVVTTDDMIDEICKQVDLEHRIEIKDLLAIAVNIQTILSGNNADEDVQDMATLFPPKGPQLQHSPSADLLAMELEKISGQDQRDLIERLSQDPKERMMIEVLMLETCRIVWSAAAPLIEKGKAITSREITELSNNLTDVQKLKRDVDNTLDEVNGVRTAIMELLDENDDLEDMLLTIPWTQEKKDNDAELQRLASHNLDPFEMFLSRMEDEHLTEMEIMLECYLQEVEAMATQLKRVDENTDDVLHFLNLHLATVRNNFLRFEVVLNILGVVFGLIGAYAGLFGMNLKSSVEETPHIFWNTFCFFGIFLFMVSIWMYRYMKSQTHALPTDFFFKRYRPLKSIYDGKSEGSARIAARV